MRNDKRRRSASTSACAGAAVTSPYLHTNKDSRGVAIERGDFDRRPKGLLARGFIRAYAREVGLKPDSLVQEFVKELEPPLPIPDVTMPSRASLDGTTSIPLLRGWGELGTVLAAIGLVTRVAYLMDLPAVFSRSMPIGSPTVEHERTIDGTDITLASVEMDVDAYAAPALEVSADAGSVGGFFRDR